MTKELLTNLLYHEVKIDLPLKSKLTFLMFLLNILAYGCYSVAAPFMPVEFISRGIDEEWIGYLFGVFSISLIIISPLMGRVI